MLGRRHDPDLHQSEPPEERGPADERDIPDVRRRAGGRPRPPSRASSTRPTRPSRSSDGSWTRRSSATSTAPTRSIPNRSGDVVVVLRPPYQSDAGTNGQAIALSHFFGQHGYLPNYVDLANNINMHGTFVMSGPGIKHLDTKVQNLRAVDIAPTLALLMGIPGPLNARGAILYEILDKARHAPRGHDPRHQRLPRPADAALRDAGHPRCAGRQRGVPHRWCGVPQDLVRHLHRRGGPFRRQRRTGHHDGGR